MSGIRVTNRPSARNSNAWLCVLIAMLLLSNLTSLIRHSHADPVLQDNGDGTITARWAFQDPANYTSQNLTVSPGSVTLERDLFQFVDTTMEDFKQGTDHYNVNITSQPGSVVLNDTSLVGTPRTMDILINESDGKDTYIRKGWGDLNYGSAWTLHTRYNNDKNTTTLIQFNLSFAPGPTLITSAELLLWIHRANATSRYVSVYRFEESWTEGTGNDTMTNDGATWNTRNGVDNWSVEGGLYWPVPEDTVEVLNDTMNWHRWNVTQLVRDWVSGAITNNGMILRVDDTPFTEHKRFYSKESLLPDKMPRLRVNHTEGPANGTFVSRVMDAQSSTNWGNISWSSVVPAQTNMTIRTRTGDCSGTWSNWSQAYTSETGSRISSPANRCLQYKVDMSTDNAILTPVLQEVAIENGKSELDTKREDFLNGTDLYNVDIDSSPGNVLLNNTILGDPPKIVEVSVDFGNGMDTHIDESFPKKNYGASPTLELDIAKKTRVLTKFDTSTVPNPQWINLSQIWLRISPGLSGNIPANISVHEVYTDWVDGTGTGNPTRDGATWETTDGNTPWTVPGGDFNNVPEYTLTDVRDAAGWYKWDATRLARGWVNGTIPNYGALFEIHFGGMAADLKAFYSEEYPTLAERPKLVVYYNSTGPSQANGTFVSRVMDAQTNVNWGTISWDSILLAQTDLTIHTRTGDCLGGWSGWSSAYPSPSGSQVTSPPNRCLQYKAEMITYQNGTSPILEEVRIDYWKYMAEGGIETENFNPVDWLGWEDFNASFAEPFGTNISFQYSTDAGLFWMDIFAGQSLQALLAQNIMFRANFKSSDVAFTPELYEMNVTYRIKNPLDHIHMSLAQWNGTVDDSIDLDAIGHNVSHQVISFVQKWATDDPWGSVNSTGFYQPGMVGTWRVFCNNSDDSVSNYTKVTVFPGSTADIVISPWDPGTITTDDTLLFNVTGYDSKGNFKGPVIANWSVTGGIGTTTPGPDTFSTFDATTPGLGQVWADDGIGHINSTNVFQVLVGARARIGIDPWSPGTLTTNDTVNFTAYDYDLDDNQIGLANVTWSVNGGIGAIPPGPSETAIFDATTPGVGTVTIDDGLGHTNTTDFITVVPGSIFRIEVQPWSPGTVTTDDTINFTAYAYDMSGILIGTVPVTWAINGAIGTIPMGPSENATFDATTPGVGTVTIDDGLGHTNTTNLITVLEGQLSMIVLNPPSVILNASEQQNFTASGYDSDGNPVPLIAPLWETSAGTITNSSDTEATLLAQDTELTGGWIRITATSQNNISAVSSVDVVLVNVEPEIAGVIPNQERPEDYGSWSIDLTAHASDAQDPLSSLAWFFTDYDPSLILISGTNNPGNHIITFTTVQNAYGNDEMTVWLRDSDGFVDSQTLYVNITSVNDAPLIQSITPFTVHFDVPYTYYFYDYVSDVETDRMDLVLSCDQSDYVTFDGLWGTFLYPQEFNGQTVYPQVTVEDEHGGTMRTVVSVTVSEDYVPVLTRELPDVFLFEGETVLNYFDLDDYFDDPDQDSLYYTSGNIRTQIIIHENHSVDFIAPEDWFGVETVTFRAIDPENARAEDIVLVTVLPINDAPTISGVPDLVVHYDDPMRPSYNYTFDLEPYIYDIDNHISELTIITSDPAHIFFNNSKNSIMELHYPQSMMGQTVVVRITVSDETSQDYQDINVTIMDNWPPEIVGPIPNQVIFEDIPLPNALTLDNYFVDMDGDDLSYVTLSTNVYVQIDSLTSNVSLSSATNWSGLEYVTFRAIDTHGAVLEQTILVTVIPLNDAPYINTIPDQEMLKGQTYSLDLSPYLFDIDNNLSELHINIVSSELDGSISIVGTFLIFNYDQEGIDTVQLSVSDGHETVYATFNVDVIGPPPPSVWDQVFWPWSLLVALLALFILFLLSRQFFSRIYIDEVFLIHRSGNLIKHITTARESEIDKDIFSGMLTAIQAFINDSFKDVEDAPVKRIEFGNRKIMIEGGDHVFLAVVFRGKETEKNVRPICEALREIQEKYAHELANWDGFVLRFAGVERILQKHLGDVRFQEGPRATATSNSSQAIEELPEPEIAKNEGTMKEKEGPT